MLENESYNWNCTWNQWANSKTPAFIFWGKGRIMVLWLRQRQGMEGCLALAWHPGKWNLCLSRGVAVSQACRGGEKIEKLIKLKNWKKNNWKNRTEKNWLNRLKFWKNRPVRFSFGFISKKPKNRTETKKPEKTEPNRKNQAKPKKSSQTKKTSQNRKKTEPKPRKPSQTGLNWYLS